jgi:hypothetical protein
MAEQLKKSSASLAGNSQADLAKAAKTRETVEKIASKIKAPGTVNPAIDFTHHTLETGEVVKTTERICKGNLFYQLGL